MRLKPLVAVMALAASVHAPVDASAALVSGTLNFITAGYQANDPAAPQDTLTGSVALQFDTAQSYTDATAGISLLSLNYTLGSPIAFSYDAVSDILRIGGLAGGAGGLDPGSSDILVTIQNLFTAPQEVVFGAYTVGPDAFSSVVARTGATFEVPEPASLALLGFGLLGLAAVRRGVG